MIHPIRKYGDVVLHQKARPVAQIDGATAALVEEMVATMYAAPGIGLAAPQIGVSLRVIVIDLSVGKDKNALIRLVNPEFVSRSGEQQHEEGCLSIPGYAASPVRPARVSVRGLDLESQEQTFEAEGLLARAFCHEIDHLDGLLFVDRLSPLKRDILKRKLRKKAREGDWEE
jgi:peptide deformylase